jgi:cytochrome b561
MMCASRQEHKMKNTENHYGYLAISVHWLVAGIVFGLFGLGFWMVDLGYYDPWYKNGPDLHKSIGFILFVLMVLRVVYRWLQTMPRPLESHSKLERKVGHVVHSLLYVLLFFIMISGYLISTADGRGIDVFELFSIPSFGELFSNQEDIAGTAHKYSAYVVIATAVLHGAAAIKHHVIDKDNTLKRMLGHRQK